jgi:hypothetical protein
MIPEPEGSILDMILSLYKRFAIEHTSALFCQQISELMSSHGCRMENMPSPNKEVTMYH